MLYIRANELRKLPHTGLFATHHVKLCEGQHLRVPGGLEGHAVPASMRSYLPRSLPRVVIGPELREQIIAGDALAIDHLVGYGWALEQFEDIMEDTRW